MSAAKTPSRVVSEKLPSAALTPTVEGRNPPSRTTRAPATGRPFPSRITPVTSAPGRIDILFDTESGEPLTSKGASPPSGTMSTSYVSAVASGATRAPRPVSPSRSNANDGLVMRTYAGMAKPRTSIGERLTIWLDLASPRSRECGPPPIAVDLTSVSRTGNCEAEGGVTRKRNDGVCGGVTTHDEGRAITRRRAPRFSPEFGTSPPSRAARRSPRPCRRRASTAGRRPDGPPAIFTDHSQWGAPPSRSPARPETLACRRKVDDGPASRLAKEAGATRRDRHEARGRRPRPCHVLARSDGAAGAPRARRRSGGARRACRAQWRPCRPRPSWRWARLRLRSPSRRSRPRVESARRPSQSTRSPPRRSRCRCYPRGSWTCGIRQGRRSHSRETSTATRPPCAGASTREPRAFDEQRSWQDVHRPGDALKASAGVNGARLRAHVGVAAGEERLRAALGCRGHRSRDARARRRRTSRPAGAGSWENPSPGGRRGRRPR